MSSPQNTNPSAPQVEKKKGIEKYVAKFKQALARSNTTATKRPSVAARSKSAPVAAAAVASSSTAKPAASAAAPAAAPAPAPAAPVAAATTATKKEEKTVAAPPNTRAVAQPEIIPTEIGPAAERVEKTPRTRVHRECHECRAEFGKEKTCPNCQHKRCKECTRFPAKKSRDKSFAHGDIHIDFIDEKNGKYRVHVTKPCRVGGQELVMKKPAQRVRRNCHECGTLFASGTKECAQCGHIRCTDCPRDPAKTKKFPYGYPNDEFGNNKAFFECHDCKAVFPLSETKCSNCGHEKCGDCQRTRPRKVAADHDPAVLRSVEEKLARLGLGQKPTVNV